MRHLIKKQIIELSLDRSLNHYRVQQQVSDQYWKEILPMLEKAFDAISSEDELIEIDHFELDLGVVSVKEIEKESWGKEIQKKISEKMAALTDPASSQYAIRRKDRRLGIFGEWLFYMDHGFLSWNTRKPDEGWYRDVLEAIAVDSRSHQTLQQRIRDFPFFLQRVVSQHADDFLHKLAEILTAKKQEYLPAAIDELLLLYGYLKNRKKITGSETDRQFKNDRWQWILESAAGTRVQPLEESLLTGLTRSFVKEFSMTTKIPASLAEKIPHVLPLLLSHSEELKNLHQREKKKVQKLVHDMEDSATTKNKEPAKYQTDEPEDLSRYNSRLIDGEGIFIVHAGTILLHPFLKSIFSRLGLLNGNQFTNKSHQVEAVGLIHYMASGRTIAEEYELALAKILCAFSLEEPLDLPESYPPEYLQEANDLLEAAIAQWSILKNTSVEGLREGFLQRGGKLFSKNGSLYLQVEKNATDILLDYLPWNLGMIKLPWIRDVLRVEWR
jgi:hypothetical protein